MITSLFKHCKTLLLLPVFTEGDTDDNNSKIILANGITINELNEEKSKTIDKVVDTK